MKFSLKTFLVVVCVVGAVSGVMGKLLLDDPKMFVAVWRLASTVLPFVLAVGTIILVGMRSKRRGLTIWGLVLLLAPLSLVVVERLVLPSGDPLQLMTTRRLIEKQLPKDIEAPWTWQELKRRLKANKLSREDV